LPARRAGGEALELVVVDDGDVAIGVTLLSELSHRDRRAVVGTWLGRAHWGTGANRETKALICRLAFERLDLERLAAYADVRNARSQAALERLGFTREGVLRAFHRHRGEARDVALYSLLRADWEHGELATVPAAIEGVVPPAFAPNRENRAHARPRPERQRPSAGPAARDQQLAPGVGPGAAGAGRVPRSRRRRPAGPR
jgi:ribosomal-protein-alanine N-acetyltransferase